jgi:hypothetical protein
MGREVLGVGEEGVLQSGELATPVFGLLGIRLDLEHVLVVQDVLLGLAKSGMPV